MTAAILPEAGKKPYLLIDPVDKPKTRIQQALLDLYQGCVKQVFLQDSPQDRFRQFVLEKSMPPENEFPSRILLKTKAATFNHAQEFVIHDNIIWYRKRDENGSWSPLFFDGFEEGCWPVEIKADGANLMAVDDRDQIHYKKVLWECNKEDLEGNNKKWEDAKRAWNVAKLSFQIDNSTTPAYIAVDLAHVDNWKRIWFSLPGVSWISSLMGYRRLELPQERIGWTVSHRGSYFSYFVDGGGNPRSSEGGTTTLDILPASGTHMERKDPWSPPFANMSFPLPATSKTWFEALKSSESASNIMLIGYEHSEAPHGNSKKTLKVLTRLSDIDIDGWNPLKKYTYSAEDRDESKWVVSLEGWKEHPLSLQGNEEVTSLITIVQVGEGNDALELRVAGKNKEGIVGFFYKKIDQDQWNFYPYQINQEDLSPSLSLQETVNLPFFTPVKDYKATAKLLHFDVALKNFGSHSLTSEMVLTYDNERYRLFLHKTKNLKHFFGAKGFDHLLIIPDSYRSVPVIQELFHSSLAQYLSVYVTDSIVTIQGTGLNLNFLKEE